MSKQRILEKTAQIRDQYNRGIIDKGYHDHILDHYYNLLQKENR